MGQIVVVAGFVMVLLPVRALAQPTPDPANDPAMQWSPSWRRMEVGELVISGVFLGVALASDNGFIPPANGPGTGRGGILFDDDVRDVFRLGSPRARSHARTVSDILLMSLVLWSPLLDSGVASAVDSNFDVSSQTLSIDLVTYAATYVLTELSKNLNLRSRPYVRDCDTELGEGDDVACEGPDRHRSFFSGHTAMAFAGASLVCIHHANLPLYGNDIADATACIGAMVLAATTGLMRMLGDMHYLTDVLLGAAVGIVTGLFLPAVLHYGFDWNRDEGRYVPPMPI